MNKNILIISGFLFIIPNLLSQSLHENTKIVNSNTNEKEAISKEIESENEIKITSTSEAVSSSKESKSNQIEKVQIVQPIDKKSHSSKKKLLD